MERVNIAQAVKSFETFVQILDEAYWAAADIKCKDHFYDLITTLQQELNELAKLSVEDHYMAYEPITVRFKHCSAKLKLLRTELHDWVCKTDTAAALDKELPALLQLLSPTE